MGSLVRLWWVAPMVLPMALFTACGGGEEAECSIYDQVYVYVDADGDGFGSETAVGWTCSIGEQQSTNNVDCDDENPDVNPQATEICDLTDNDCNDLVDEASPKVPWYPDLDGDGYGGNAGAVTACRRPSPDFTQIPGDCNDESIEFSPVVPEICDGLDNDCDGRIDDRDSGVVPESRTNFWRDRDGDGYGDPQALAARCEQPPGFVTNDGDCDDRNDEVNPDATTEFCDFIDNDCDGFVDDEGRACDDLANMDLTDLRELPCDCDGDGFGDADNSCLTCRATPGVSASNDLDCDDDDPLATVPQDWLPDLDQDTYGDGDPVFDVPVCLNPNTRWEDITVVDLDGPPDPAVAPANRARDCSPEDASIFPGAPEICGDAIDQDCSASDCSSCKEWQTFDSNAISGIYQVDVGNFNYVDLYCDMVTDGGGWTMVGSSYQFVMDDRASGYFTELTSLSPSRWNNGVYNGLRRVMTGEDDLRFACKIDVATNRFDVDLSFYSTNWYGEISGASSDFQSCFEENQGQGDTNPPPARRDNLRGVQKLAGDTWNSQGYLEGEDFCGSTDDFTVDLDDRGVAGNSTDGTDWGEWNNQEKCGTSINMTDGAWFLFFREGEE